MNDYALSRHTRVSPRHKWPILRPLFGATALFLTAFACIQMSFIYLNHTLAQRASGHWAHDKTHEITSALAKKITSMENIADELALSLSSAQCGSCDIESTLRSVYFNHAGFDSLGVAYGAYQSGSAMRLYAPFIRGFAPGGRVERIDNYYDYLPDSNAIANLEPTQPMPDTTESATGRTERQRDRRAEEWYGAAIDKDAHWMAPRYEAALSQTVLRYTQPLVSVDTAPSGLVFIDLSLDWLRQQMDDYDLHDNNYLIVLNADKQVVYHSLQSRQAIIDGLDHRFDPARYEQYTNQVVGINELTGKKAWFNRQSMPGTNWEILTTIGVESANPDARHPASELQLVEQSDRVIWISWLVVWLVCIYSYCRMRRSRTTRKKLWIDSALYTVIFLVGILAIWGWEYGANTGLKTGSLVLSNKAILDDFQKDYAISSLKSHQKAPTYVPVGLFIQSIEFISATNVNLTGYIWHRYLEGEGLDLTVGTIFPEAIQTNIKDAYTETIAGETLRGWYFETTLRERFDPRRFPFDRQSVWLRLWHEKLAENIVLVPDFDAYDSLNTRSLPGIEKDFVLSGWTLFKSFFDMRINTYNTSFGRSGYSSGDAIPELYFNIELSRNFLNPFIAHLFPLFVVLLMLYAIVVTLSHDQQRKEFLGSDVSTVVASCSALFFVALLAHVQMRRELAANSVVYLEYFYLLSYLVVLAITTNAVLFSWKVPIRLIQFHDNLIPKLVYWPLLFGGLFICTVAIFL
jgi:hypothetical protein